VFPAKTEEIPEFRVSAPQKRGARGKNQRFHRRMTGESQFPSDIRAVLAVRAVMLAISRSTQVQAAIQQGLWRRRSVFILARPSGTTSGASTRWVPLSVGESTHAPAL
jgi:hypothetical protein